MMGMIHMIRFFIPEHTGGICVKIGVVDAGGGFRGIYGAGILDYCLEQNIQFDYCIGVSAGSGNVASYLAGQKGRNRRFYGEYGFRDSYCGFGCLLKTGDYLNIRYIYGDMSISTGEYPLDYQALAKNPAEFYVVAVDAHTGQPLYLGREHIAQDRYEMLMASCALPGACRPVQVGEHLCFDGGFGDPIPVQKAFDDGCDKVVVILSKTRDTIRRKKDDNLGVNLVRWRYPQCARELSMRYKKYNDRVLLAKEYEKQGKVLIVAPESTLGMTTLGRTQEQLDQMYAMALEDAKAIEDFIRA